MPRFDEEDDEMIDILGEYERFIKKNPSDQRRFDEWLEDEYGDSKKKVMKPKSNKGRKIGGRGSYE